LDEFVMSSVESGRFESTTELVRAALVAFHRQQTVHTTHTDTSFGAAIAEGRRVQEVVGSFFAVDLFAVTAVVDGARRAGQVE